jgi:hypothetical protein
LLRNIFHILPASQDPAGDSEDAVLMAPHQFFKSLLVFLLRPSDEFPVIHSTRRFRARRLGSLRTSGRAQGLYFWDACHVNPVTFNVACFPLPV